MPALRYNVGPNGGVFGMETFDASQDVINVEIVPEDITSWPRYLSRKTRWGNLRRAVLDLPVGQGFSMIFHSPEEAKRAYGVICKLRQGDHLNGYGLTVKLRSDEAKVGVMKTEMAH